MTDTNRVKITKWTREWDLKRRSVFCCVEPPLNNWFKNNVPQETKNLLSKCYIALINERIVGFYSLSASHVALDKLTEDREKRLRYKFIPVVRIGRLAVDKNVERCDLGSMLVYDAAQRILGSPIGAYAIIVDSKVGSTGFYRRLGFTPMPGEPDTVMLLRLKSLLK